MHLHKQVAQIAVQDCSLTLAVCKLVMRARLVNFKTLRVQATALGVNPGHSTILFDKLVASNARKERFLPVVRPHAPVARLASSKLFVEKAVVMIVLPVVSLRPPVLLFVLNVLLVSIKM